MIEINSPAGLIPINAKLTLTTSSSGRGWLEMDGTHIIEGGDTNNIFDHVHPLTISLDKEDVKKLKKHGDKFVLVEKTHKVSLVKPSVDN